jgi:23S rRNA (guanine745-N1)-methyltransferase
MDRMPLAMRGGALRCANDHSFDIARQGYANLLGAQDKRSKDPGDSKAMIAARHGFLEAGYYQPLADRLGELLLPALNYGALIVDAGCGEGYYLQQLRQRILNAAGPEPQMVGFDISKWALQSAARRFSATWLVASNRNIPLADSSADVVLDMFGFPDFADFARVLKPDGLLLRVQAGSDHLRELREIIYPEVRNRATSPSRPASFSSVSSESMSYPLSCLKQSAIAELLLMTPHFFRASAQGRARVAELSELTLSVDFCIELLRRNSL